MRNKADENRGAIFPLDGRQFHFQWLGRGISADIPFHVQEAVRLRNAMATLAFEDWVKKFERIGRGTPAWNALQRVVDALTQIKEALGGEKPEWLTISDADEDLGWSEGVRRYVLRFTYRLTLPPPTYSASKLKQDAYTRRALARLTKDTEAFVTHLQKTSVWVTNDAKDRYIIDLTPVLQAYKTAAAYSRQFLNLLERPYTREPALFEHFLGFMGFLDRFDVLERDGLELLRFALLTHGYTEEQLDELLDRDKVRDGLFRKRKQAARRRDISFLDLALGGDGKPASGKSIHLFVNVRKNHPPK